MLISNTLSYAVPLLGHSHSTDFCRTLLVSVWLAECSDGDLRAKNPDRPSQWWVARSVDMQYRLASSSSLLYRQAYFRKGYQ